MARRRDPGNRARAAADARRPGERRRAVKSTVPAPDWRDREHERAQRALRQSEERFRLISETIAEVFWIADTAIERMIYVSPGYERLWGRSCASLYENPRSFLDAVHPDDRERVLADLAVQSRGLPFNHEYRIVRPDGEIRWIWDRGFPVSDPDGHVRQYVGTATDITERRTAEHALREAEERMRFALSSSRVGIWEADLKADTSFWSETCEVMHGVAPGTFGRTFQAFVDRIHPEDREPVLAEIDRAIRAREDTELHYRTTLADGSERHITSTARFFYDQAGVPERGAGVTMDVTERRSLEERLRQAQKMEAIGRLAGGIAHDFNNLLQVIIGNAELVHRELTAAHRRFIEEIITAAEGAEALTRQLLAFSRRQVLTSRVLRLGDVVDEITPMLRRLLGETIDLRTVVADRTHVKADAGQLQQVILNLALNARDAMPDGGQLTIETADVTFDETQARQQGMQAGAYVRMAVTDTGHGMDEATGSRAFEPFFTTKPVGQGTGLGLATVHGIVTQSDGYVSARSAVAAGTTFTIHLPQADDAEWRAASAAMAAAGIPDYGGDETILLVEDEPAVRSLLREVLGRFGYVVHAMPDAGRAVEFAEAYHGHVHAVVTDVGLPDMNVRSMVARITTRHPEAGVLLVSGHPDKVVAADGVLESGTWFLQKPFTPEALGRSLREVLANGDEAPQR